MLSSIISDVEGPQTKRVNHNGCTIQNPSPALPYIISSPNAEQENKNRVRGIHPRFLRFTAGNIASHNTAPRHLNQNLGCGLSAGQGGESTKCAPFILQTDWKWTSNSKRTPLAEHSKLLNYYRILKLQSCNDTKFKYVYIATQNIHKWAISIYLVRL